MSDSIEIKFLGYDHPDSVRMCEAQQEEIKDVKPKNIGAKASAANIPVFAVAYTNGAAVGCGGLRPSIVEGGEKQAEIKRMYVGPAYRGGKTQVALVVLEALEQAARDRKWMKMKLGTSRTGMTAARKFYEKHGYVLCEEESGAEESSEVFYEKNL